MGRTGGDATIYLPYLQARGYLDGPAAHTAYLTIVARASQRRRRRPRRTGARRGPAIDRGVVDLRA